MWSAGGVLVFATDPRGGFLVTRAKCDANNDWLGPTLRKRLNARCTPSRLTNLRTARLADMDLTMRLTQWLRCPCGVQKPQPACVCWVGHDHQRVVQCSVRSIPDAAGSRPRLHRRPGDRHGSGRRPEPSRRSRSAQPLDSLPSTSASTSRPAVSASPDLCSTYSARTHWSTSPQAAGPTARLRRSQRSGTLGCASAQTTT